MTLLNYVEDTCLFVVVEQIKRLVLMYTCVFTPEKDQYISFISLEW